jgi:hypothetical protein
MTEYTKHKDTMAEATPLLREMLWLLWFCLATCWSSFLFITMLLTIFYVELDALGCLSNLWLCCMHLHVAPSCAQCVPHFLAACVWWFVLIFVHSRCCFPALEARTSIWDPKQLSLTCRSPALPPKGCKSKSKVFSQEGWPTTTIVCNQMHLRLSFFSFYWPDQQQKLSVIECTWVCHSSVFTDHPLD